MNRRRTRRGSRGRRPPRGGRGRGGRVGRGRGRSPGPPRPVVPGPASTPVPAPAKPSLPDLTSLLRQVSNEFRSGRLTHSDRGRVKDALLTGAIKSTEALDAELTACTTWPSLSSAASSTPPLTPSTLFKTSSLLSGGSRPVLSSATSTAAVLPPPPPAPAAAAAHPLPSSSSLFRSGVGVSSSMPIAPKPAKNTWVTPWYSNSRASTPRIASFLPERRLLSRLKRDIRRYVRTGRLCVHDAKTMRAVSNKPKLSVKELNDAKVALSLMTVHPRNPDRRDFTFTGKTFDVHICHCNKLARSVSSSSGDEGSDGDTSASSVSTASAAGSEMDLDTSGTWMTIKLRTHFFVQIPVGEDLRVLLALEGRPPRFHSPLVARTWWLPKPVDVLRAGLSVSTRRLLTEPNAGGSSVLSEALSFEVLQACFHAKLSHLETEVVYTNRSSIVDYLCTVQDKMVGVSVTRAMKFEGGPSFFTTEDAERLLRKKLAGLLDARTSVTKPHAWTVNLLHVWCEGDIVAERLAEVMETMDEHLWATTIVLCTVTTRLHHIIFKNVALDDESQAPFDDEAKRRLRATSDPSSDEDAPPAREGTIRTGKGRRRGRERDRGGAGAGAGGEAPEDGDCCAVDPTSAVVGDVSGGTTTLISPVSTASPAVFPPLDGPLDPYTH